jgi:hypothetical protein
MAAIITTIVVMVLCELWCGRRFLPDKVKIFGYGKDSSRQLWDLYSPSHIIHGFAFYWMFGVLWQAILVECLWEMLENSSFIINRYRKTSSVDYTGDTVLNSLSDVGCMSFGFMLCMYWPAYWIVLLMIAMELATLWLIKDNLLLNIIMLAYPFETIKDWQTGRKK